MLARSVLFRTILNLKNVCRIQYCIIFAYTFKPERHRPNNWQNFMEFLELAFLTFKKSYRYTMGGTQTVILPSGERKNFDDRRYYEGRGKRFNHSVKHDIIGDVVVSKKEYAAFIKEFKLSQKAKRARDKKARATARRIAQAKRNNIYTLHDAGWTKFVELSEEEKEGQFFDAQRLANTLDISLTAAERLHSVGKTYVFAEQFTTGKVLQLFHPSLDCNRLSISVHEVEREEVAKFNHNEWLSAPFSRLVGMTDDPNHFVC